jgi:hypothetical protein
MGMKTYLWACFCLLIGVVGILSFTGCGVVFVNTGSKNASLADGISVPVKKTVSVPPEQRVVMNFEDGSKNTNPKLYGGADGVWMDTTFAGNTISGDMIDSPGANGTSKCAHIYGTLTDKGDGQYPAFQLQGNFKSTGYYDASAFTGIKFYYKCPPTDKSIKRRFGIGIAGTLPTSMGGSCTGACFNNFGANMTVSPDWVAVSYSFADLKRESGWGDPVSPPDLTDHLKEFISLVWANSANNTPGSYAIDYSVDEVEFY